MALNTYDAAKHHIGLKIKGGATNYGFMLNGGYRMEMQREAIGAQDFGGSTDLIGQTASAARWTQDDFTGGQGQYSWAKDDAMFAECLNFMPDPQSRRLLSCPPMYLKRSFDPDLEPNFQSNAALNIFVHGAGVFVVFSHGILRWDMGAGTGIWAGDDSGVPGNNGVAGFTVAQAGGAGLITYIGAEYIKAAEYDPSTDRIVVLTSGGSFTKVWNIKYLNPTTMELKTNNFDTGGSNGIGRGLSLFGRNILVQGGQDLWIGTVPEDANAVSAELTWAKVGRLPGYWKDHCEYNGQIYIITNDGGESPTFKARVSAYDGDSIVPVAQIPHSFMAKCITSYGGRIYIGGTGTDVNGGEHYGELYEMTGSSLRLVRTFSPETRRQLLSTGDWPSSIDDMTIHEGLLWFCQKGSRMIAYDQSSDGFFGASEIISNADLNIQRLTSGRGRLWGWGVDDTTDANHGIYRIAQPADSVTGWQPKIITSDFVYEPGVKKRWSEIKVMTRYGPVENIDYSLDSGNTWTALTVTSVSTYTPVYWATAPLVGITPSENIRFRIRLDIDTPNDAVTYVRELVAFTVSYLFLDTGKRAWDLSIIGADIVETMDAEFSEQTTQAQDMSDMDAAFDDWAFNKQPLTYTDVDGTEYDVSMVGYTRSKPLIAPDIESNRSESMHIVKLVQV